MKLSNGERLIIALLCDISRKLDASHEVDPSFVVKALNSHEWALGWQYSGLIDGDETPAAVRETCDILDMWRALEEAYDRLSAAEKARVDTALGSSGEVRFSGFDGNHDEHFGIARFLIEEMKRYEHFKDRYLNSHHQGSLPRYRSMLRRFDRMEFHSDPSADRIIAAMKE